MPKKRQPRKAPDSKRSKLRKPGTGGPIPAYEASEAECIRLCGLIEREMAAGSGPSAIAKACGVSRSVFWEWINKDAGDKPALQRVQDAAVKGRALRLADGNAVAADALLRSATGAVSRKTTVTKGPDGEIKGEKIEETLHPPNAVAVLGWLNNNDRTNYSQTTRLEVTGQVNHVHTASLLDVPGGAFLPGGSTRAIEGPTVGGHVCQDAPDGDADAVDGDFIIIEDGVDG